MDRNLATCEAKIELSKVSWVSVNTKSKSSLRVLLGNQARHLCEELVDLGHDLGVLSQGNIENVRDPLISGTRTRTWWVDQPIFKGLLGFRGKPLVVGRRGCIVEKHSFYAKKKDVQITLN